MQLTIPSEILDTMANDQPRLIPMIENLKKQTDTHICQGFEKTIVDNYLMAGTQSLTPLEMWQLAACCVGDGYAKKRRN